MTQVNIDREMTEITQKIQRLEDKEARMTGSTIPKIKIEIRHLQDVRGKLRWKKRLAEATPEIRKILKIKDNDKRFASTVNSLMEERITIQEFEELHQQALITGRWFSLPIQMIAMLSRKVNQLEKKMKK